MNELLRQHQIALINAQNGQCGGTDQAIRMVRYFEKRLAHLRSELGVWQY